MENREEVERRAMVDELVMACLSKGYYVAALKVAETMGASPEVIESLIKLYIEMGRIEEAVKASQLIPRRLKEKEIYALLEPLVRKGLIPYDYIKNIKINTPQDVDRLVLFLIEKADEVSSSSIYLYNLYLDTALDIAPLGAGATIDYLVKICIQTYRFDRVIEAVKLGASEKAIKFLLDFCIKKGLVDWVLKLLEHKIIATLTLEEIRALKESVEKIKPPQPPYPPSKK